MYAAAYISIPLDFVINVIWWRSEKVFIGGKGKMHNHFLTHHPTGGAGTPGSVLINQNTIVYVEFYYEHINTFPVNLINHYSRLGFVDMLESPLSPLFPSRVTQNE
ncbi:hypothetical protein CMI37_14625 [Candidatus Pacearchaeota archaeon]|nr:hypothetical protein [Candidatus Pacearchaeota archaeon]|tara:strand:+ start:5194 stop:5511 length:318 start_codon:yes stop_codon:yes gene_type:complete